MFHKSHVFAEFSETFMNISWKPTTDERIPNQSLKETAKNHDMFIKLLQNSTKEMT